MNVWDEVGSLEDRIPELEAENAELKKENEAYGHRVGLLRRSAEKERQHLTEKLEENVQLKKVIEIDECGRPAIEARDKEIEQLREALGAAQAELHKKYPFESLYTSNMNARVIIAAALKGV